FSLWHHAPTYPLDDACGIWAASSPTLGVSRRRAAGATHRTLAASNIVYHAMIRFGQMVHMRWLRTYVANWSPSWSTCKLPGERRENTRFPTSAIPFLEKRSGNPSILLLLYEIILDINLSESLLPSCLTRGKIYCINY